MDTSDDPKVKHYSFHNLDCFKGIHKYALKFVQKGLLIDWIKVCKRCDKVDQGHRDFNHA